MRGLGVVLLSSALAAACGARGRAPEVLAVLPEFSMTGVTAEKAAPFARKDLLGTVWVADFVFTNCGGPCPLLTQKMREVSKLLPPQVALLSVTVDPDNDSPKVLRDYAAAHGVEGRRWVYLRGSVKETYDLIFAGFRLPMSIDPKAPPESRVQHSTRFVLVDSSGAIRGFYDGLADADHAALARDARRLLEAGS